MTGIHSWVKEKVSNPWEHSLLLSFILPFSQIFYLKFIQHWPLGNPFLTIAVWLEMILKIIWQIRSLPGHLYWDLWEGLLLSSGGASLGEWHNVPDTGRMSVWERKNPGRKHRKLPSYIHMYLLCDFHQKICLSLGKIVWAMFPTLVKET